MYKQNQIIIPLNANFQLTLYCQIEKQPVACNKLYEIKHDNHNGCLSYIGLKVRSRVFRSFKDSLAKARAINSASCIVNDLL